MTATINASAGGVVLTSDTSGSLALQSGGVTKMTIGSGGVTGIEATQAEQEAATSVVKYVTPGRQQYHPSAAKFWASVNQTGTQAIRGSYNVASISDGGAGITTVTIDTDFSSVNWCPVLSGSTSPSNTWNYGYNTVAAGSIIVIALALGSFVGADCDYLCVSGYGDQ